MNTRPAWLNTKFFPFKSNWMNVDGNQLHYVDEGSGDIILFVHGTPEWSFGFRDLIKELSKNYRCIAIDHLGFGLSDKPEKGNYTCEAHAYRLQKFIQQLDLENINLVANDFGGGFALNYAIYHPEKIRHIFLFNTWMWSLKSDNHYSGPAKVVTSWLGRFLYLKLNFPVNVVMPAAYGDKKKLTKEVHVHYKKPLSSPTDRIAAYTLAHELMNASDWWQSLWNKLNVIENTPFTIFWGLKDKFVPAYELEKWKKRLPYAKIVTFEDAGHFVQEEKPNEMIEEIKRHLKLPPRKKMQLNS
jgi:pimeloyl-ACP methyl ester carboxylesterase